MGNRNTKNSLSAIERDIVINGIKIHVKSVFSGHITLEDALTNIIVRRLTTEKSGLSISLA